jgi:predicted acylesterase/phospholipase RssA
MWRRPKIACILCGGGITGAMYEIGVLTALEDFLGPKMSMADCDIYVGTSAGSMVAVALANGIRPTELFEAIIYDRDHPFNFRREDIFGFGWKELHYSARDMGLGMLSLARSFIRSPWRFSMNHVIRSIDEGLGSGFFTTDRLERYVQRVLSAFGARDSFSSLDRPLLVSATNLDTGRYVIFGLEEWADVPLSKAVAASCAIPFFYRPVRIRGVDFVDGGVAKVAYARQAAEVGAKLMIIVNPLVPVDNDQHDLCIATTRGECGRISELGLSRIGGQIVRINNRVKLKLGLQRFQSLNPGLDIMLFQPRPREAAMFLHNVMSFRARRHILHMAYCTTAKTLHLHPGDYENMFRRYGLPSPQPDFSRIEELHKLDPTSAAQCRTMPRPPAEEGFLLPKSEIIRRLQPEDIPAEFGVERLVDEEFILEEDHLLDLPETPSGKTSGPPEQF